jgi:hypothetical protein
MAWSSHVLDGAPHASDARMHRMFPTPSYRGSFPSALIPRSSLYVLYHSSYTLHHKT